MLVVCYLGNQLWQAASTIGIAFAQGEQPRFPKWVYQPYFSFPEEFFVDVPSGRPATDFAHHIDERARVYLQDYGLWRDVENSILMYLQPGEKALSTLMEPEFDAFWSLPRPVLAVHVRRGDNVQANDPGTPNKHLYHPLRPKSYYQEAIASFGSKPASVAFFSDDIEWCEQNFDADYFHHGVARPKEHEPEFATAPVLDWIDLHLLAKSTYHVLGGSTFSWWAAFMSGDDQAVYPLPWFGPALAHVDTSLMFPSHWNWRSIAHPLVRFD